MIRILICDDEGIVRESVKYIIQKGLEEEYELEFAKNGRAAIELADVFRPDIILMDIQMPGINGLEAMQEIRKGNKNVIFIVLTAYDKFEYTQRAISSGVMDYLTKPIRREKLIETLKKAIKEVGARRKKIRDELEIKEKLELVLPMIESGLVHSIVLNSFSEDKQQVYRDLLNIEMSNGYVLVIACGDELRKGTLVNTIGAGIRLQKHYMAFRESIKDETGGFPGTLMDNKVILVIPCEAAEEAYEKRLVKIENIRTILRKLDQQFDMKFKAGIGSVTLWENLVESYREAMNAIHQGVGKVNHIKDLQNDCLYEADYPIDLEKALFAAVKEGDPNKTRERSYQFLARLQKNCEGLNDSVRLKAVEFVLGAEFLAYSKGGRLYQFGARESYLKNIMSFQNYDELGHWFVDKMGEASRRIDQNQQDKTDNVIDKAKYYIKNNFTKNISLEDLAKELGISPYYFSKLFKEAEGVNYIDYVTNIRIEYAKEQLRKKEKSIKEICVESGYSDPNYFSRIFKKLTGVTPTEYREGRMK